MAEEIQPIEEKDSRREGATTDVDDAGKYEKEVVIDIVDSWAESMNKKLISRYLEPSPPFTICRVPQDIRKHDHGAYNPKIVSIGPFHRRRRNLQAMEELKRRSLSKVAGNELKKYFKKMKDIETKARNCYSENFKMESKEFVEMMVLDSYFILQLFLGVVEAVNSNSWMGSRILHDLLLLENQLPFFVLEDLWDLIMIGKPKKSTLQEMALKCLHGMMYNFVDLYHPSIPQFDVHHLLHLLHMSLKPVPLTTTSQSKQHYPVIGKILSLLSSSKCLTGGHGRFPNPLDQQSSSESVHKSLQPSMMIPSAKELKEAGVKFQIKNARSFLEVTFENGNIKMPCLSIEDDTNSFFRNFVAFEQCFLDYGNHFTSYCFFMDSLVNSQRDVEILKKSGTIHHMLGSDKEVALLFNQLCNGINWDIESSYLETLFARVFQYTQRRWPKWRAKMVHDYFSNPWAILTLIGAIFILILTSLQSFFTVFGYFRPHGH